MIGQNVKTLKDATGKLYGRLYAAAKEGQNDSKVSQHASKPGTRHDTGRKGQPWNEGRDLGLAVSVRMHK